ncbi:MAG: peptidylprolyl isomerase [Planctomycetota bacterium]|nr:peptidylprolyl isomerase [Planctomycetota bacterium]
MERGFGLEALEPRNYLAATLTTPLTGVSVGTNAADTFVNLSSNFNDTAISGTVVQMSTNLGVMNIELNNSATPLTVANFLAYVNSGAYNDTFFHRSAYTTATTDIAGFQQVMDNTDATGVNIVGSWATLTDGTNLIGPDAQHLNYLSDQNTGKGTKSITFTPDLPRTGHYNVFIRWTAGADRATNATVIMQTATGTITGTVNEQQHDRAWVQLNATGSPISFAAGTSGSLTINNTGANGTVTIDAVAFQLDGTGTSPTPVSFVIQGGGFKLTSTAASPPNSAYVAIPANAAVQNEPGISNVRGTIAMAKTSLPNSATNQFFFNVNSNTILDDPNRTQNTGGFTAFGHLVGVNSFRTMDAIAGVTTINFSDINSAFSTLPTVAYDKLVPPHNPKQSELVRVLTAAVIPELSYNVSSSNSALVTATVTNGQLKLHYATNGFGAAKVTIVATSVDGTTATTTLNVNVGAPAAFANLFNETYYLQKYPDVKAGVQAGNFVSGLQHFFLYGQREGRSPSPYWDEKYYLFKNPDVAAAVSSGAQASGFAHFALSGQKEGRDFSPYFSERFYLAMNPDVVAGITSGAQRSGYEHWILFGLKEKREFSPIYSEKVYLASNPDVASAVTAGIYSSGFEHFLRTGQKEGRKFSLVYNEAFYLARNPDVAAAVNSGAWTSGFEHFVRAGIYEKRVFNPWYDEAFYLTSNTDVANAVGAGKTWRFGLEHFIAYGQREARKFSKLFDESVYRLINADVASAVTAGTYRSGFEQFISGGQAAGKIFTALFDESFYRTQNPDVNNSVINGGWPSGLAHFLAFGRAEGRRYSRYFDAAYYLAQHPEVATLVSGGQYHSALEHFALVGQYQGWLGVAPPA